VAQPAPNPEKVIMAAKHYFRARIRFLAVLSASGALAQVSCGGSTDSDGAGGSSGGGGQATGGTPASGGSVASGGVTASGGAPNTGGTAGQPSCNFGQAKQLCYSLQFLENQLNNGGPWGGDAPEPEDAGPPIKLTECPAYDQVQSDCCNPAVSGPEKQGELCCYVFCEGGCCGRAFVVDGVTRLAEVVGRGDWLELSVDQAAMDLDEATRAALAVAWRQDARMEHASVASFARFTLELLSLAAPADLVVSAQRAALDEVEHARLCFGLASRFAGSALGPAGLDVSGAGDRRSLADAAVAALVEGAIGETVAAMLARAQLAGATDAEVRRALVRIAVDEENHAELGWRFVCWALAQGGAPVRAALSRAAIEALKHPPLPIAPADVEPASWRAFGRLSRGESERVVGQTMREVIEPCLAALLSEAEAHASPVNQVPPTHFARSVGETRSH
jgi:hypothetical protein